MYKIVLKLKKSCKKSISLFMVIGILLQTLVPTMVMAISYEDCNLVTIGGNPTINVSKFEYENGDVTITKNGVAVNTPSFSVEQDDEILITLAPNENYSAKLHNDAQNYDVTLTDNAYSFKIGNVRESTLSLTPSFNSNSSEPPVEAIKFDFTFNGKSFTNVSIGDQLIVPDDFNMDSITEFYVTKITIEGVRTYTYAANEYSYALIDNQERKIFETHFDKRSDNYASIRIQAHNDDILDENIAQGKTKEDYFGFYITGITFVKSGFKGVEAFTNVMPDNYDFTVWNGADLSSTTKSNPGKVTAYYGENTISLSSISSSKITEIKLANDNVPSSAVSINNETAEITILSNYYNEIPLQIKLDDGTTGYITINRIGIFIGDVNIGNNTFYHGAFANVDGNLNVDTDKYRIVAVFYHDDTTTYNDYDLIVNVTYEDGSTETTIAQGVGDVHNSSGNIIGSDYILWKSKVDESPKSVSVTAVKKGATSNASTFGGATFGSGAGVVWSRN